MSVKGWCKRERFSGDSAVNCFKNAFIMRLRIEFKRGQKAGVLSTHLIKLEAGLLLQVVGNSFSFASNFKKSRPRFIIMFRQ